MDSKTNSREKSLQVLDKKKSTGRILKRPSVERKSAMVYLDGKGKSKDMRPFTKKTIPNTHLILCRGHLSDSFIEHFGSGCCGIQKGAR
jgi:ribosome modulation factor